MGRHGLDSVQSNAWEKHHQLPIHGVRSERQMHRLLSKLTRSKNSAERIQHLVYEIKASSQPFSADQVLALAPFFPGAELVLMLHLLDHHLFGLYCNQASELLQMIPVAEERLEALQVIDENLLDPVHRFQLRNQFPSEFLVQVDQILKDTRGQSHIFGPITSLNVIFLIDTSHSMNTEFQTHCGQQFNRLQYIVHDLHQLLHHRVQSSFKFNIIHFNTHVHQWKQTLTPATAENLKQAEYYLDHLEGHGQSNIYDALRIALSDEEATTIYLLSDGEPSTDINTILSDLSKWLKKRRNPCLIHTILFSMGNASNDHGSRKFMADIAAKTGGVFRCMDPLAPLNQDFDDDSFSDATDFSDDEFRDFFQEKTRDIPRELLDTVGVKIRHT